MVSLTVGLFNATLGLAPGPNGLNSGPTDPGQGGNLTLEDYQFSLSGNGIDGKSANIR